MKYRRVIDDEEFDEDEISQAAVEAMDWDDLEEAAKNIPFSRLWQHLDVQMRETILDIAIPEAISTYFFEVDDEEEDEE